MHPKTVFSPKLVFVCLLFLWLTNRPVSSNLTHLLTDSRIASVMSRINIRLPPSRIVGHLSHFVSLRPEVAYLKLLVHLLLLKIRKNPVYVYAGKGPDNSGEVDRTQNAQGTKPFRQVQQEALTSQIKPSGNFFWSSFYFWVPFLTFKQQQNLKIGFHYLRTTRPSNRNKKLMDKSILNYKPENAVPRRLIATYNFFDKKAFGLSDGAAIPDECSSFVFKDMRQAEHALNSLLPEAIFKFANLAIFVLGNHPEDERLNVEVKVEQTTQKHHFSLAMEAVFFWLKRGSKVFPPDADPLVEVTATDMSVKVALPGLNENDLIDISTLDHYQNDDYTCDWMLLGDKSQPIGCKYLRLSIR